MGSNPSSSASWENVNLKRLPRGAKRAVRLGFERDFWRKGKGYINEGQKKFFIMNQKEFINILLIIIVIVLVGAGGYFVLSRQVPLTQTPAPTPIPEVPTLGPITVGGEIVCLPRKGPGPHTEECTIGLRDIDGRHYGLKNFPDDPEQKFHTFDLIGLRLEISGIFNTEKLAGSDAKENEGHDIVGVIDISSIAEIITKKLGEQEGSFLIQKINQESVDGLWYQAYPVARSEGEPRTLHIGDDIGYTCEGVSEKLISINFSDETITFNKVVGEPPFGGCPRCLAGNSLIDTPSGLVPVKDVQVGMPMWTVDKAGHRVSAVVAKTSKVPVSPTHQMVHLVLDDGRELFVSSGHPTINGRNVGDLTLGDLYDGSSVVSTQHVPYSEDATYDVLPSGETGFYWANGILFGSTLRPK